MPTFDASTDRLLRTSGVLDQNSPYTVMAWIRASSISGAPCIFAISAGTYSANGEELYISVSLGNRLTLYAVNGGTDGFGSPNGTVLSTNTWYHVTIVRESSTSLKSYLNGVFEQTCSVNIASRSASSRMEFGAWSSGNNDPFSGRIQYIKIWNTALTAAEIAQEVYTVAPRKLDSLWGWYPTRPGSGERAKDYSGNGRDWTEGGTLTDDDPPPVSWGGRIGRRFRAGATTYNQAIGGTLTSSGALVKQTTKTLAGTLTSTGALTAARVFLKAIGGTLTSSGALVKQTTKTLAGTLTSTGALVKHTTKALAGTLTSSGALTAARVFLKAIGGTLTSSGALVKTTTKTLAGTLSSSGSIVRRTTKILAGTLSSAGALVKQTRKVLGGTLTSSGGVAILRAVAYLRNAFRVSADVAADIPAIGRAFTVAADAPADIPSGGRSFRVAADAASEQL